MSTPSRVQVECPSCHAAVQACIVGIGRRLPCPHCGQPVLLKAGPAGPAGTRPDGVDARLSDGQSASTSASLGFGSILMAAVLVAGGAAWWWLSRQDGTLPVVKAWSSETMAGGAVLLLAVTYLVSARAAAALLRVVLPLCCVGFLAWKAIGPGGVLSLGPLGALAAPSGASRHALSASPSLLLEFLPDGTASDDAASSPTTLPTAVAGGATPVTFVLEGVAGIDVGATVRRSLSVGSPGLRPSWSITTRGGTALVTLWMGGDFDHIAQTLPIGREQSRDAAARRVVIHVDPARCVRRR